MSGDAGRQRRLSLGSPLDLARTIGVFRHGAQDPTCKPAGEVWWLAQATVEGASTVALEMGGSELVATAWGPGARWSLAHVDSLVGEHDDPTGFVAHHELAAEGQRLSRGWRVARSALVVQSLIPAILEQKVTGREAFASHARLVRRFGRPAPGPGADLGLWVPPAPADWARIPSWEWLQAGVDGARSASAVRASGYAGRLEECADLPLPAAHARLRALPGIGEWTAAEVSQRALGDPDSPSFGDYHMARNLTFALTGRAAGDDEARALLAPYVGHRYRAQVFIASVGPSVPRRGPRRSLPTHLPTGRATPAVRRRDR